MVQDLSVDSVMEALVDNFKSTALKADEATRKKIVDTLRDLSYSLETPQDSMQRLMYIEFQLVLTRIGCDINLFRILSKNETPMTTAQIAQQTKTAPTLLNRILRFLASHRIIAEVDEDQFTANQMTRTLGIPGFEGGIYHYHDCIGPALHALPDFLKEHQYRDIEDRLDCPIQKGHSTTEPLFDWFPKQKALFTYFNRFMTVQRMGMPTWLDEYPYQQKAKELSSPDQVYFVDIGGGFGHQCIALRNKITSLPNSVILEDMAPLLQQIDAIPGVEIKPYDFWTTQPVKGAKIYYMRNIMHDYPDDKAAQILQNTKASMGPDSVILIDDMVIPESGAHWQAMQIDITMMVALASIERTRSQWDTLMAKAGLKINKIYNYTTSLADCIIECVPV